MTRKDVQIATPKNKELTVGEIQDDLHQWAAIYF